MEKSKIKQNLLIKLYIKQKLSTLKISKLLGLSAPTIRNYLIRYKIKLRTGFSYRLGSRHLKETKKKIRLSNLKNAKQVSKKYIGSGNPFYGKKHTKLTKRKIANSNYHKNLKGKNNPNFGSKKLLGKNNPNYKGGPIFITCDFCKKQHKKLKSRTKGQKRNFCDFGCYGQWRSKNMVGDKCGSFVHGEGNFPYPLKFSDSLKLKIRTRDGFVCQNPECKITEIKHVYQLGTILHVHHIDYNKENCDENNLITLCRTCNLQANGNKQLDRDYWYAFYTYIMENE